MDTVLADAGAPPEWHLCPGCGGLIYGKRLTRSHHVCPECDRHAMLSAPERLALLLDPDSAVPIESVPQQTDPLDFADTRPYRERLRQARQRTGLDDAVLCVRGTIEGN